jgi:hypothetical protein
MRALAPNLPNFKITTNTVALYMTEPRLLTNELCKTLEENEIPINKAERVAVAMAYLVSRGLNGKTIYCAANGFREVEDAMLDTVPQWLGEENF